MHRVNEDQGTALVPGSTAKLLCKKSRDSQWGPGGLQAWHAASF
jgi:hypothetical protein